MYSLWNDNLSNVQEYIKKGYTRNHPLSFNTSNRGVVDKFKLEELDALTTQYKDEKDFVDALSKYGNKYIENPKYQNIIMVRTKGEHIYENDIIYNDLLLHQVAKEVINKKQNKTSGEKITIDNSDKVIGFINYIKRLATDENSKDFLLQPLIYNADDKNLIELNRLIDDDIVKDGIVIKKGLKSLLSSYVYAVKTYNECIRIQESPLEALSEVDRYSKQINEYIRSDYRVFRNLIAWENRYYKTLEFLEKDSPLKISAPYVKLIQEVKMQRQFRNGKLDQDILNVFYNEWEEEYDNEPPMTIQNETMLDLYNEGGVEEVMNHYSIGDIYESKENYETAVKLGIISKNKK